MHTSIGPEPSLNVDIMGIAKDWVLVLNHQGRPIPFNKGIQIKTKVGRAFFSLLQGPHDRLPLALINDMATDVVVWR